jgi:protein-disulfide isomerase
MSDRILNVLIGLTLLVIGLLIVRPEGLLGSRLVQFRERRRLLAQLASMAPALDSVGRRSGPATALHILYEFSDYECPYCRASEPVVRDWLDGHPDVTRVYVQYPLPSHPAARNAAKVVLCAERQGLAREIHDSIMATLEWRNDTSWTALTYQWGLKDTLQLQRCMHDAVIDARLARGIAIGDSLGLRGTPAFFSGGRAHWGAVDQAALNSFVE